MAGIAKGQSTMASKWRTEVIGRVTVHTYGQNLGSIEVRRALAIPTYSATYVDRLGDRYVEWDFTSLQAAKTWIESMDADDLPGEGLS